MRKGKTVWITETVKGYFENPKDAYDWGINFIERYNSKSQFNLNDNV